ncbi:acidic repeat-containing protein [Clonorchis sinensis]|uniref:Acidic repeat-containing protein n=1 Tax=Clonorchis sinensis TaxID=79923 RepID=G7YWE2_CLOSI|nr:acidic repeat-containing protein [Clonorchis sinensis]
MFALEWREVRGEQRTTWQKGVKEIMKCFGIADVDVPGLGPRDLACAWLEALQEMAADRYQWRSCFQKTAFRDTTPWSPSSRTSDLTVESTSLTTDNRTPKRSERSPLAQLQLEPANSNRATAAKSSVAPDESSDDDAFEKFLAKLRRPPSPKYSSGSSSSFFTDNSSSGSQVSDEQLFYCQFDNAARSAHVEAEKKTKEAIEHCVFLPGKTGYQKAMDILRTHFDRPHDTAQSFTKELLVGGPIDPEDVDGLQRLIRKMVNCDLALRQMHYTADLNCSANLKRIVERLRRHLQQSFVKRFKANRVELANRLFRIFNEKVFEKRLPDDLSVVWNTRLLRTAGQCKYLRREVIPRVGEKTITRIAQIELSPKVCTSAERVRDTLLHEVCHAAVWILDGVNDGHGSRWRRWANRAMQVWPDIPVVSVCHAYTIETKFTYRCTGCGACINRHSKSIDTEKQICGRCRSRFELLINTPRGRMMRPSVAGTMDKRLLAHCAVRPQVQPSELNEKRRPAFADFVRENYRHIRQKPEIKTHSDAMTELGSLFKTMRISKVQPNSDVASLST